MPRDITSIITDLTTYEVFCRGPKGEIHLYPRALADMDHKGTIADIASGQFDDIVLIRETNIKDRICRDVTEDMLSEAGMLNPDRDEAPTRAEHAAWVNDHRRDLLKHEERV